MSAVSNSVTPRSIALWITLREVSRSMRWPKLLQPRPTAETRKPEPPRLRICMDQSCAKQFWRQRYFGLRAIVAQGVAVSCGAIEGVGAVTGGSHAQRNRDAKKSAAPVRRGD